LVTEDFRYIQPLDSTAEWKVAQETAVTVVITSLLSLKVSNIIRFANAPVPGFKATDTLTSVALVLTFERRSR
jgi:putative salt-induced outer membrane protein YdiY